MLRNIALVLASTLMSLGLAEVVVRTYGTVKTYTEVNFGRYEAPYHPPYRPLMGPHNITTPEFSHISQLNSLGLRDDEIPPKSQGETRILFLGDSFTYGVGVETNQTWIAQLRSMAQQAFPEKKTRLINGGLPGWDVVEHLRFYRAELTKLEADLVVLVVNSSDLNDLIQRGGVDRTSNSFHHPRSEVIWRYSHLFRWVMVTFFKWDYNLNSPLESQQARRQALKELSVATHELALQVEQGGHRFVVFLHPYPFEIERREDLDDFRQSFKGLDVEVFDAVGDFYERLGAKPRVEYSFVKDGHFNLAGYTVFAEIIWEYLGPVVGSER